MSVEWLTVAIVAEALALMLFVRYSAGLRRRIREVEERLRISELTDRPARKKNRTMWD